MTDAPRVHRYVTIEQVVRGEQPEIASLDELFAQWGLTNSAQEALWTIAIDNMTGIKTITETAKGGWHDVVVVPATILAAVLAAQTDRFYIAHNHPNGPVTPTDEDMHLTGVVMAAANAAGLSFEDHIIVGPEGRFSFYEEGLLVRADALGIKAELKSRRRRTK